MPARKKLNIANCVLLRNRISAIERSTDSWRYSCKFISIESHTSDCSILPMRLHPFPLSQWYIVLERFHLSHEWHKSLNIAIRISICKLIFSEQYFQHILKGGKKNHNWGRKGNVQDLWHVPHNEITNNCKYLTFLTGHSSCTCQGIVTWNCNKTILLC